MIISLPLIFRDQTVADAAQPNLLKVGCRPLDKKNSGDYERQPNHGRLIAVNEDVVHNILHDPGGEGCRTRSDRHQQQCSRIATRVLSPALADEALKNLPGGCTNVRGRLLLLWSRSARPHLVEHHSLPHAMTRQLIANWSLRLRLPFRLAQAKSPASTGLCQGPRKCPQAGQ